MKNMKKIFTGVAIATTLFASSAVLADSGSKFSAFDGVPSESVSRVQLDEVSGNNVIIGAMAKSVGNTIGGSKLANSVGLGYALAKKSVVGLAVNAADTYWNLGQEVGRAACEYKGAQTCPGTKSLTTTLINKAKTVVKTKLK